MKPILLLTLALTSAFAPRGAAQCGPYEDQKFGASTPLPNALYGYALDVSGTRAVVGAYNEGPLIGAAYFLGYNGSSWVEEQRIPGTSSTGEFGRGVAIDGDTAVVGARSSQNKVWVFRHGGSQWAQEQVLVPFGAGTTGWFGHAIDVDGDVLAAGAYNGHGNPNGAINTGRAWVWRRSGTAWAEEAELHAPDGAQSDRFGESTALSGDWIACGAGEHDSSKGAAYLFHYDGTSWQFHSELQPTNMAATARFGHSLDLDGDTLIVGAYLDTQVGSVYVYRLIAGQWVEEAKIIPSGLGQQGFGEAVALSGDEAVIHAYYGSYVERWSRMAGNWIPIGRLLAANASSNSAFLGEDLAVSGTLALLGDYEDDEFGNRAGAAYAYDLAAYNGVCTYCTAQTNSQGCTPAISSTGTPSASAGSGFVVAASDLVPGQAGRFIYSTQIGYSFTSLMNGGTICIDSPTLNAPLLNTGGSAACSGTLAFDFNAWIATGNDPSLVVGAVVHGQFWSRDVGVPARNITDAISLIVLP